ncbi:hypothetical protein OGAPHI_002300 [Ogataea philodendri]|uniref:Uncharacterized protein n=1 Tax=Ogataea philodendri TaxID=1378263 RepID=A0A9P8PB72_9ASCO|nr:uncharacterized protein OGAPHI_002300 [Ogataea philodendri]KAH3668546.1 hypothetical protein OGAPHI_002300 [Ogataea philodendri]
MTGLRKNSKLMSFRKQSRKSQNPEPELRKKRKLQNPENGQTDTYQNSLKSELIMDDSDDDNNRITSKKDLRSNFSNIINQQPFFSHPSGMTIDLHSEMKLQRQRRLIELDMMREKELNHENNDGELSEDDLLSFSSSEDEEFMDSKLPKLHQLTRIDEKLNPCNMSVESLTTGLEQVDHLIRQYRGLDAESQVLNIYDHILPLATDLDEEKVKQVPGDVKMSTDKETKVNESDCHLISETSSFRLLAGERLTRKAPLSVSDDDRENSQEDSSNVSLEEFLNLEFDGNSIELDGAHNQISKTNATFATLDIMPQARNFEYRYNHDKINLALVNNYSNFNPSVEGKRSNKRGPLNKSALFYGNHSELSFNNYLFQMNDFVI